MERVQSKNGAHVAERGERSGPEKDLDAKSDLTRMISNIKASSHPLVDGLCTFLALVQTVS